MSKVYINEWGIISGGILVVLLSDDHCYKQPLDMPEPSYGDEVDCPICADIEKRVKAARLEALQDASNLTSDAWAIDKLLTEAKNAN